MAAQEEAGEPLGLRDLGVPAALLFVGSTALAASAFGAALALGAPPQSAAAAAAASLAAAVATAISVRRRLRSSLRAPVDALLRTIDQARMGMRPAPLPESGAPLLQPLLRRFALAHAAMETRSQKTAANLMQAEAAFDRVHAVLQSLREGVLVVDTKGRVVLMNRNARRMLGLGDRRVEAEPLLALCTGTLGEAMQHGLARLDADRRMETRADDIAHNGRVYDLSIVQVQSNRPDQDYGKVLVLADVTQRHEVDRLKDGLLSSISHELRTPLTNMVSASEILTTLSPTDATDWHEFATMFHDEAKRMKTLVDDIMEYGQLEQGSYEWRAEPTSLRDLAATAVAVMRNAAAQKRQRIELEGDVDAIVQADPRRMREAICRILDNAVKFTPEGGRIRVTIAQSGSVAEARIDDDGPGISTADCERVFERFQQLGDVMTDKPKGSGLGLAICKRIVEAARGSVRCEKSDLGGASFVIALATTIPANA